MEQSRVAFYNRTSPQKNLAEEIKKENKIVSAYLENNDIELVGIYRDIECHTVEERPQYNKLIKDIFEGKIDKLVITGTNRLTRNIEILEKIGNAVEIILLDENGKKSNNWNDMLGITNLFNEWYKKDLSNKIKRGIQASKKRKQA